MRIKELETQIPGEIREAKRRTTAAVEKAVNHKMLEAARHNLNDLYMAMFFWQKYHTRKRTHDFYTKESQQAALETIMDYLRRI